MYTQRLFDRLVKVNGHNETVRFLETCENADELFNQLASNDIGAAMLDLQDGENVTQDYDGGDVDLESGLG